MSFINLCVIIGGFLTIMSPSQAANIISCPKKLDEYYLDNSLIFDGPPENIASLIGERGGYWNFYSQSGFKDGVYLVCYYKNTKKTWELRLPKSVKSCTLRGTAASWNVYCE